jgi:hypothetical protein
MDICDWESIKNLILEREKYLICRPNVIHLQYSDGLLSERIIEDFENKLKLVGLELSRFRISGSNEMFANLNKSLPVTFFLVSQPVIGETIEAKTTNEKWETLKCLMFTTWKNVKGRYIYRNVYNEANIKELIFKLKVILDVNTSFSFKIPEDLNEVCIQNTFDKILLFLREQKLNNKFEPIDDVYFDTKEDRWLKGRT